MSTSLTLYVIAMCVFERFVNLLCIVGSRCSSIWSVQIWNNQRYYSHAGRFVDEEVQNLIIQECDAAGWQCVGFNTDGWLKNDVSKRTFSPSQSLYVKVGGNPSVEYVSVITPLRTPSQTSTTSVASSSELCSRRHNHLCFTSTQIRCKHFITYSR